MTKFGWTVLSYPQYSPDLAPSNFYIFGPPKEELKGLHVVDNNAVIVAVKKMDCQHLGEIFTSAAHKPSFMVGKNAIKIEATM